MNTWIRRIAVVGTALALSVPTGVAAAQKTDYAPITISPEKVEKMCEERAPRIEERVDRLTKRINGGADVVGSTAWLQAQLQKAKDAGNTGRAERLENRVSRRAEQSTRLGDVQRRVDTFQEKHCGGGK